MSRGVARDTLAALCLAQPPKATDAIAIKLDLPCFDYDYDDNLQHMQFKRC
jgi:hypothetical protein